jgi:hypothetical protein
MFSRFTLAIAGLSLALVGCAGGIDAKDYKIGTEFSDVFKIDFDAGRKSVPLPPGIWKLVSTRTHMSGGSGGSHVNLMNFYLIRHSKKNVTGVLSIRTPIEIVSSHWGISTMCSQKRKDRSWYYLEDSFDRNEDCNLIYPIRGFKRNYKPFKGIFDYIESRSLIIPNTWVTVRFVRSQDDNFLRVNYALPQENYGFAREIKYSNTKSPWSINNINAFPKKKDFKERAVAWTKSWKGLVDKGFKNELRKEEVIAHPRIDGTIARKPAMTTGPLSKPSDPSIEGRLRKLQQLLDKKLITPEEFGDRRRKILDKI